jgi:hypothetical protein
MLDVPLFPGLPGGRWARVRPLTGEVEQCIEPEDPCGFGRLLDALLVPTEGTTVRPGCALDLALTDHDRIAVALYCHIYGERVEARLRCRLCEKRFDVSFQLTAPAAPAGRAHAGRVDGPDESGAFVLRNGIRFRLPTGRDRLAAQECAVGEAREVLLRRCVEGEISPEQSEVVEEAMQCVGPLISDMLTVSCPHCGRQQDDVQFSIQRFLLDGLAFERRFLFAEVHQLARAYRWSYRDILTMPTRERRAYVGMILAERSARA